PRAAGARERAPPPLGKQLAELHRRLVGTHAGRILLSLGSRTRLAFRRLLADGVRNRAEAGLGQLVGGDGGGGAGEGVGAGLGLGEGDDVADGGGGGQQRVEAGWAGGVGVGAAGRGSAPDWVLGKVMTSRMEGVPASSM